MRHWELVESYGLQTLCECHERRFGYPAVVYSGKIAVLEKTLAGKGDDEPILAGKRVLEKELEKLQKKLNGPKKTAKHIEAKQNWINRESKRLEAETVRLTELQESIRARKETLKVVYEEIKILREDLMREGESMDKNKSHFLSPEDTEEIRRLEQQELAFWRGSASKRLAGWTRDCLFVGGNRWLDDGSPGEFLEFVGSMVCLDGNARHAIAHRTAQANKCRAKWKLVLNSHGSPDCCG